MLELKNIVKIYGSGETQIKALDDVSLSFKSNEFVSILGASGCGKTTLLNLIGGLDRYTSGDLLIKGKSTKEYNDSDWDAYRNHAVGFVFQSYNLINHLSVLGNVELALTLSGVSVNERRKRAEDVLKRVGLGREMYKRPNQLSGGQMQRVAIARALVNNPNILLADEPTGALDSVTSVQILELLKEVARERLVIMVTHNRELADRYSTRIIKLVDGKVTDDSMPYTSRVKKPSTEEKADKKAETKRKRRKDKTAMSFWTALTLSARNLITKKARTILTAAAGSIGIIGIALILAMSTGFQAYIDKTQADTLSTYPISISETTYDMQAFNAEQNPAGKEKFPTDEKVTVNEIIKLVMTGVKTNNMDKFANDFLPTLNSKLYKDIQYAYDVELNVFKETVKNGATFYMRVSTGSLADDYSNEYSENYMNSFYGTTWGEVLSDAEFLNSQYDVLKGRLPGAYNEVVIIVDQYNRVSDYTLSVLGLEIKEYTFDELLSEKFMLVSNDSLYQKVGDIFVRNTDPNNAVTTQAVYESGTELNIVGILRVNKDTTTGSINSSIGYTTELTKFVMGEDGFNDLNNGFGLKSSIVDFMRDNYLINPFTNSEYDDEMSYEGETAEKQYNEQLLKFCGADKDGNKKINTVNIYPTDYSAKEDIKNAITAYNDMQTSEEDKIYYSDIMDIMMSAISTAIDAISYVLIAFTSVSLVVSSIMIGIITYVSVIERTKEIGILRSVGARKKDIGRVFNAETMIIGFAAGLLGVLATMLLTIPINIILNSLTGVGNIAFLNPLHGLLLIAISVFLTFIAGMIPARIAARKDPVEALRSE